jgi:hypothetical protein
MFTDEDKDAWARRCSEMTQESANASLTEVKNLREYTLQEPRLPYALPSILQGPSLAYLSVPPVTHEGYTENQYQNMLTKAGVGKVRPSVSSFGVTEVAGVRIDGNGAIWIAVVWSQACKDGGTWITLEDLNVLFDNDKNDNCSSSEDNTEAPPPTQKEIDAEIERSVQRHNWDLYFGREVDEDLEVLVGFTHGANTTIYAGVVLMPDFEEQTGHHRVHFPIADANALFGTAPQDTEDDNIDIRLDTLHSTNEDTKFWVKKEFVGLKFIQNKLPSLKIDQPQKKKIIRRNRRNNSSSDDSEEENPKKKKKPTPKAKKKPTPKAKKKPNAGPTRDELFAQLRGTPM